MIFDIKRKLYHLKLVFIETSKFSLFVTVYVCDDVYDVI